MGIGLALLSLGVGIAQGYGTKKQGKKIARLGEEISRKYKATGKYGEKLFKESEKNSKEKIENIRSEQKKQADLQLGVNKEEIKRALEKNIRGALGTYSNAHNNLVSEIKNVRSQLAFKNDIKNVEKSSIKHDMESQLSQEALEQSRAILENQEHDLEETIHKSYMENYQAGLSYNRTIEGINQNYLSALSNAEIQAQRDLFNINSWVNAGVEQGREIINQGHTLKDAGDEKIASSIMNFGTGMFNKVGGFGAIAGKFGLSSNIFGNMGKSSGAIREVEGTFKTDNNIEELTGMFRGFR